MCWIISKPTPNIQSMHVRTKMNTADVVFISMLRSLTVSEILFPPLTRTKHSAHVDFTEEPIRGFARLFQKGRGLKGRLGWGFLFKCGMSNTVYAGKISTPHPVWLNGVCEPIEWDCNGIVPSFPFCRLNSRNTQNMKNTNANMKNLLQ